MAHFPSVHRLVGMRSALLCSRSVRRHVVRCSHLCRRRSVLQSFPFLSLSAAFHSPSPSAPFFDVHRASSASSPSSTVILDGRSTAARICDDLRVLVESNARQRVEDCISPSRPGLAVLIAGGRRDSQRYVARKMEKAKELGFHTEVVALPSDCSEADLLHHVQRLNADERVHGVLVQLPLPSHISQSRVLQAVSIEKDVDGFHPYNMGLLALNWKGAAAFVPWEKRQKTMEVHLPAHPLPPSCTAPPLIALVLPLLSAQCRGGPR